MSHRASVVSNSSSTSTETEYIVALATVVPVALDPDTVVACTCHYDGPPCLVKTGVFL